MSSVNILVIAGTAITLKGRSFVGHHCAHVGDSVRFLSARSDHHYIFLIQITHPVKVGAEWV